MMSIQSFPSLFLGIVFLSTFFFQENPLDFVFDTFRNKFIYTYLKNNRENENNFRLILNFSFESFPN